MIFFVRHGETALNRDGRLQGRIDLELSERGGEGSDEEEKGKASNEDSRGKIGVSVQELTPQVRQMGGLEATTQGLLVVHVKEVSPAADAGLTDGDIITQVNGKTVTEMEEFSRIVKAAKSGDYLRLYVYRPQGKVSFFALVKID